MNFETRNESLRKEMETLETVANESYKVFINTLNGVVGLQLKLATELFAKTCIYDTINAVKSLSKNNLIDDSDKTLFDKLFETENFLSREISAYYVYREHL